MKSANLVLQQYGAVGLSLSYSQNFRFFSENQNFSDLHITDLKSLIIQFRNFALLLQLN